MVTAASSVRVNRAADDVFAVVGDPVNDVKWHHNVLAAHKTSDGPIGVGSTFVWDAKFLGRRKADVVMRKYEPPRVAEYDVRSGWMRVVVGYVVEPDGDGSTVTRSVSIPLPGVLRPIYPLVRRQAEKSGKHHVAWLRDVLEGRGTAPHDH
jgi:hypothetical protein